MHAAGCISPRHEVKVEKRVLLAFPQGDDVLKTERAFHHCEPGCQAAVLTAVLAAVLTAVLVLYWLLYWLL